MDTPGTFDGPLRVGVCGATGRVGARVCALAEDDARFLVTARWALGATGADRADPLDLVIDFSCDEGARRALGLARDRGAALLVGTTGLSSETLDAADDFARSRPLIVAPNTSLGVALLARLVRTAAHALGERADVDIMEAHHRAKRDAPSGTALRLAAAIGEGSGLPPDPARLHAIRAGDIAGEHTVFFSMAGERLVLSHHATSRDLFARGALDAGAWLARRPPGQYTIDDALGL
jgi:4-hydroxy-tetrahydrodipicolinate reductase